MLQKDRDMLEKAREANRLDPGDLVRIDSERSISHGAVGKVVGDHGSMVTVNVNGYTGNFAAENVKKQHRAKEGEQYTRSTNQNPEAIHNIDVQTETTVTIKLSGEDSDKLCRALRAAEDATNGPITGDLELSEFARQLRKRLD